MSKQLSVATDSSRDTFDLNFSVDKYFDGQRAGLTPEAIEALRVRRETAALVAHQKNKGPGRLTPEAIEALRSRVKADCLTEREAEENGNPTPHLGKGKTGPGVGQTPRASTHRNNSSLFSPNLNPSNDSTPHGHDNSASIRTRAYELRRGHRGLVKDYHKALALCGLGTYGEKHERKPEAHLVCDHGEGKADFRRVSRCRSSWACPVCSAANSTRRTHALGPQVRRHMAGGGTAWLLTLTLRHKLDIPLAESLAVLSQAWSSMTSGEGWKGLLAAGDVEWVRGFDVTHGRHGWHPHVHVLLLLDAAWGDGDKLAGDILARWRKKLKALGWDSVEAAQDCRRVDDPEKAVAYAVSPAAVDELTAITMKRMRKGTGSRTPFEILEGANGTSKRDKALWLEYVQAVKGRQQATCSKGLTFDVKKVDDVDEEDGYEPPDVIAGIGREAINELDKTGMSAPLLDTVEAHAGDPEGVREAAREILSRLVSRDWRIFARWEALEELEDGRERAQDEAETRRLAAMEPDGFRRQLDDIDRRARAIPDSPEEVMSRIIRERAQARMPKPIGVGLRDPAEMLLSPRERFARHLTS